MTGQTRTLINRPEIEAALEHELAGSAPGEQLPSERAPTADNVATLIAFLCSDDAAYMTGSVLLADGGASLLHGPAVEPPEANDGVSL